MLKKTLALLSLVAVTGAASAAITVTGGTYNGNITAYNPSPLLTQTFTSGMVDATLSSLGGTLTATFLGKEAVDLDTFTVNGTPLLTFNNLATAPLSASTMIAAGNIPFILNDLTTGESVGNGGNPSTAVYGSYAVFGTMVNGVFTAATQANGQTFDLIVGFNDGSRNDADFDDVVVGLTVAAIPEPETYALMLGGLGALAFVARRRRKA